MRTPRLAPSFSKLRRLLQNELVGVLEVVSGTPPTLSAPRSWHARLECLWMRLTGTGPAGLPVRERQYPHRFLQQTTCFIYLAGEVRVWKGSQIGPLRCPIVYRYYKPDESLLAEGREDVLIKREWESFSFRWGWGWQQPGNWTPGTYRVEMLIGEITFQSASFTIKPPPQLPPLPPPTLTEILYHSTVRFYASRTGCDVRQDSVRFPQETTREIICALMVRNLFYRQCDQTYPVTAQCYTPEGKSLWESHQDWEIKTEELEPSISWAWQPPGQWEAGAYRVEIQINGEDFAWGVFAIE